MVQNLTTFHDDVNNRYDCKALRVHTYNKKSYSWSARNSYQKFRKDLNSRFFPHEDIKHIRFA